MIQAKRRGLVDKIRETWKLYLLSDKPFHCTSSQWIHEFVEGGGGGGGARGSWRRGQTRPSLYVLLSRSQEETGICF